MLVVSSLFVVSIFVAHITAAMTVGAIQSSVQSVNDLYGKRVGTTAGSTTATVSGQPRYSLSRVPVTLKRFVGLLRERANLDAVVFDAPILSYYVNTEGAGIGTLVGPDLSCVTTTDFALPTGQFVARTDQPHLAAVRGRWHLPRA